MGLAGLISRPLTKAELAVKFAHRLGYFTYPPAHNVLLKATIKKRMVTSSFGHP